MWNWKTILAFLAAVFLHGFLIGCGILHPETKLYGGPFGWGFEDSKDNNVKLAKASYNKDTGEFGLEGLEIVNNASNPIAANVEQLKIVNEQMRIHGENIARSLGLITALAEKALPGLQVSGPLGGSATMSNSAIDALIQRGIEAYIASKGGVLPAPIVAEPVK